MALKLKNLPDWQSTGTWRRHTTGCRALPAARVRKEDYKKLGLFDLWFPALAPSRKLLSKRDKNLFARYRSEILNDSESRQTLLFLAEVAKKTPISIGCYCEDESRCHRSVLASLLRAAGSGKLPDK